MACLGSSNGRVFGLVVALLAGLLVACNPVPVIETPNIVLILTDDVRLDDLGVMPNVRRLIGDRGMTFDKQLINVSTCCPSRVSILRGQYANNTGVQTNVGPKGGFQAAHSLGLENANMATALDGVGYHTGYFGKYLNGYPTPVGADHVPPGWDMWSSATAGTPYSEYDYTLNQNGAQVDYGSDPSDYGTDVYFRQAASFIDGAAAYGGPFFAHISVYAPHNPWVPAPQDVDSLPGTIAPTGGAYNEADVEDKPAHIRSLPPFTPALAAYVDRVAQLRAESLQAVDRGVANLVDDLDRLGELDNTYIIFTSDNGYHMGDHRLPLGKQSPYESDVRVPLLVAGPGVPAGSNVSSLTGNIDLAPTILDIGNAAVPYAFDGRSLLPLLEGGLPATWRRSYLLQHWVSGFEGVPRELEPDPDLAERKDPKIPQFAGLRSSSYKYVEYTTGERELYDLGVDPYELVNIVGSADPALLDQLHRRLRSLKGCSGISCRRTENLSIGIGT